MLPADVQPVNLQDTLERLVREANEHGNGLVIVERIALATIAAWLLVCKDLTWRDVDGKNA